MASRLDVRHSASATPPDLFNLDLRQSAAPARTQRRETIHPQHHGPRLLRSERDRLPIEHGSPFDPPVRHRRSEDDQRTELASRLYLAP